MTTKLKKETPPRKFLALRLTIVAFVLLFIIITNLLGYFYLEKTLNNIIIDVIIEIIISTAILIYAFKIVDENNIKLNDQIDQLTEAYKYIGQINRKIDSLLELDISHLDRSKKLPIKQSCEDVFAQLVNILNADYGLLTFFHPFNFNIHIGNHIGEKQKANLEQIITKIPKDFISTTNPKNKEKLIASKMPEDIFKKYNVITKPVYMHDKDIGQMILVLPKNIDIDEREFNIIRVFSFYLALNATFKPEFKEM